WCILTITISPGISAYAGSWYDTGSRGIAHRPPPRQVVPGVDQRIVALLGRGRQRRATDVVPALPQVLGEPGNLPGQRRHGPPELGERDVVVRRVPGPQLDLLAGRQRRDEEREQIVTDPLAGAPGGIARG